mmetsp:Transcript_1841/g.2510  ORF Transcript_1841/g.2510 Transcript_1841/m.2510 type:complete len:176 (-) Transcript_1841:159-686(-)|eukprot:CAMPEP_0117758690 /NCGR_PEP_ID=MMETSP0947-20121206/15550_1 /TAXON_ID=44440 /ORGANISM="Chattonella subsalsa, Strain CCMP2191" /LENGTH=175 /DNA_ID=CAMNT_0005578969 /DNA_START=135 /DNA_END=662 /DNA_ORIENTATION=+
MSIPKVIVFDLDYTMWKPEMNQTEGAPFSYNDGKVFDKSGTEVMLFPEVAKILHRIRTSEEFRETKVVCASRTEFTEWAFECLDLIDVHNGLKMKEYFTYKEIYPGRKTAHFAKIQETTQVAFEDMLFYDNEMHNIEDVGPLGVTCICCPQGLSESEFDEGLELFARNKLTGPSS